MDTLLHNLRSALGRGDGIKALLLDARTTREISPLISHAELLSYDFFLFESISRARSGIAVSCVSILSKESLEYLVQEVKSPKYKEYFLFLTDELDTHEIEQIALNDLFGVVKELHELYLGCTAVDRGFFLSSALGCSENAKDLSRLLRGLGVSPRVRYAFGSPVAYLTAETVARSFSETAGCNAELLVLDRSFDLFTPLLYPWTYQAMAAEYLRYDPGLISAEGVSIALSDSDAFFRDTKFSDIVSATEYLGSALKKIKESRETLSEFVSTIKQRARDSERLIQHLLALKKISAVCVHNDGASELLADIIEAGGIPASEIVNSDLSPEQKRRALLIALLCSATQKRALSGLFKRPKPSLLDSPDVSEEDKGVLRAFCSSYLAHPLERRIPEYAKDQSRKTGYVPVIQKLAAKMESGSLSEQTYPVLKKGTGEASVLIIYIAGGATFIEHRALQLLFSGNRSQPECILVSNRIQRDGLSPNGPG